MAAALMRSSDAIEERSIGGAALNREVPGRILSPRRGPDAILPSRARPDQALGFRLPPTMRSQDPAGTKIHASFWPSRLEVPAQDETAVWQSFLPALEIP
jgi:hypothetical protein